MWTMINLNRKMWFVHLKQASHCETVQDVPWENLDKYVLLPCLIYAGQTVHVRQNPAKSLIEIQAYLFVESW